jgi:hypothetical protein
MKTLFSYSNANGAGAFLIIEVVSWKENDFSYGIETKSGFVHTLSYDEFKAFFAIFRVTVGR